MKQSLLKKIIVCLFSINIYALGATIEEINKNIDQATNIHIKQILMCERESFTYKSNDNSNPNVCLKAVEYLKSLNEADTDTRVYVEIFGENSFKKKNPNYDITQYGLFYKDFKANYRLYFEEFKADRIAASYLNAGIIYHFSKKYQNYKKALEMYKKSYENGDCNSSECTSALNIGALYLTGNEGIEKNLVLGYKYTKEAAEKGNSRASKNLEYVCLQTPWVCK